MIRLVKILIMTTLVITVNISSLDALENDYGNDKKQIINKISEVRLEQDKLNKELKNIEKLISEKKTYTEEKNNNIIQLSFVASNEVSNTYSENEITYLEETKEKLESDIENLVIEEVRLEKSIIPYMGLGCWPVPGYNDISSYFGYRIHPITNEKKMHKGIDIPANTGSDIVATDDGIVTFSGVQNGYGNIIEIEHFGGKTSKYAHNNDNLVDVGEVVTKGQVIAKIGSTGISTGPHVHFEVLLDGNAKNPLEMIEN